jgi:NAD dependent epimerase/dehydratase family enzyme
MQVAVTGASGLIGTALVRRLEAEGHRVLRLTRSRPTGPDQAHWDPAAGELDPGVLAKADAVVHLAAKSIGDQLRWTARTKREILQTRVEGTGLVARTMAGLAGGPGGRGARGQGSRRPAALGCWCARRGWGSTATGATRC